MNFMRLSRCSSVRAEPRFVTLPNCSITAPRDAFYFARSRFGDREISPGVGCLTLHDVHTYPQGFLLAFGGQLAAAYFLGT